ncbi:MAG: Holliday junction resolvase RuvX [Candidatus Moraniibacteriota bacterium]
MGNYLGIDWGAAKVGVALAHGETGVALAYATLLNDGDLIRRLGDIITSEDIGIIVIGIPEYIHREQEESGGEKLGQVLSARFGVAVEYQNEMFTTKMAQANLIERGEKGVSKHDDEEAARIILQEWLERKGP